MCHTTKAVGFQQPCPFRYPTQGADLPAALQPDCSGHPRVYDRPQQESGPCSRRPADSLGLLLPRRRWRRHPLALPHTLKLCPPEVRAFRVVLSLLYHDWRGAGPIPPTPKEGGFPGRSIV